MKSIFEFAHSLGLRGKQATEAADLIEARDAEHRAEIERAEQGEHEAIEQMKKWMDANDRLKGELAEARGRIEAAREFDPIRIGERNICGVCLGASHVETCIFAILAAQPPAESTSAVDAYPCNECGAVRTKAEGGTVFTACDMCWGKRHRPACPAPPDGIRERLAAVEREVEYLDTRRNANEKWVGNLDNKAADHERRLAALEAKCEPAPHEFVCTWIKRHSAHTLDRHCDNRNCSCAVVGCTQSLDDHPKGAKP